MANRELVHRIKNSFAIVAALVNQTAFHSHDKDELVDKLRLRLGALSRAHEMQWSFGSDGGVTLRSLFDTTLGPYDSLRERITLAGPQVALSNDQLTPLSLMLHELTTNSIKYGGLSRDEGALSVSWTSGDEGCSVVWRERLPAGSPPAASSTRGFGTTLIDLMATQLGTALTRDWSERSLTVRFDVRPAA